MLAETATSLRCKVSNALKSWRFLPKSKTGGRGSPMPAELHKSRTSLYPSPDTLSVPRAAPHLLSQSRLHAERPAPSHNGTPTMPQKVYIETVGCQMNVLDSELVIGALRKHGYDLT